MGTVWHLIFEMFRLRDGTAVEHVPYRGTSESRPAMPAGDVPAMFDTLLLILPQIRSGAVRALAVTTPQRVPQLPDVPTLTEAGYREADVVTWYAVIAPAGTPPRVVDRLYTAAGEVPAVQALLAEQGLITLPSMQRAFARRVAA